MKVGWKSLNPQRQTEHFSKISSFSREQKQKTDSKKVHPDSKKVNPDSKKVNLESEKVNPDSKKVDPALNPALRR